MHPEIEIKRYTLWNEIVRILDDNIMLHSKHPKRKIRGHTYEYLVDVDQYQSYR